ncbi:gamma-type small acid-soluble spore protein [Priestia aryabhattai]|uniref:gamma-type small acid-soluble spore protein n=1 Tax=Priestia TaxID=2800373 RepID=UPI001ADC25B7|nr:gamma-type small acid-soluble spore protein [Priestia aryabhattai]USL45274.1 gamma-type small acid-soluble spore protein [Priestia megaterium]
MEVIVMTNNQQSNKTSAGTNAAKVKHQNAASASNKFGTEFASETDVQAVKQQNAQAEAKKNQNSGQ